VAVHESAPFHRAWACRSLFIALSLSFTLPQWLKRINTWLFKEKNYQSRIIDLQLQQALFTMGLDKKSEVLIN
jgi:hypothetical protein